MTEAINENIRMYLLYFLNAEASHTNNADGLQQMLDTVGRPQSRDQVLVHLDWLKDTGLLTISQSGPGPIVVAKLTIRGVDVAESRTTVTGVARIPPHLRD